MIRLVFVLSFLFSLASQAELGGIIKNTPLDPDTWKDTIKNTPADPKTWIQTAEDLTDPLGVACTKYLEHKRETQVSYRGLTDRKSVV